MTAAVRLAVCPPWCAGHTPGTDETSRPLPHYGAPARLAPRSAVSVYPALLESGDGGPEVIIDRAPRPAEACAARERRDWTWVRLSPVQAVNLAEILQEAGQGKLAGLIREAAAVIAPAVDG